MVSGRQLDLRIAKEFYKLDNSMEDFVYSLSNYSTNDITAFRLWQDWLKSGFACCNSISSDYNYAHCVKITLAGYDGDNRNPKHKPDILVERESFALAVCEAILKALNYQKRLAKTIKP